MLFVGTANTLSSISPPLLDRCEVIECSGYVIDEKMRIADRFLLPKQVKENGLEAVGVRMKDEVLSRLIGDYTREVSLFLKRTNVMLTQCRRACETSRGSSPRCAAPRRSSTRLPARKGARSTTVTSPLRIWRRFWAWRGMSRRSRKRCTGPGSSRTRTMFHVRAESLIRLRGLAYQGSGLGGTLLIETTLVPGGKGRLVLTGSLGEVIRESAELALTFVKAHAAELGIEADASGDVLRGCDMHVSLHSTHTHRSVSSFTHPSVPRPRPRHRQGAFGSIEGKRRR